MTDGVIQLVRSAKRTSLVALKGFPGRTRAKLFQHGLAWKQRASHRSLKKVSNYIAVFGGSPTCSCSIARLVSDPIPPFAVKLAFKNLEDEHSTFTVSRIRPNPETSELFTTSNSFRARSHRVPARARRFSSECTRRPPSGSVQRRGLGSLSSSCFGR